ncbi:MAG TPA: sigma 54-interacting transcriptional regulator, partial [Polyangiales bacterium]|nr:sigma 54-interacting transcriptional regulator [Polyangiales bacterium]
MLTLREPGAGVRERFLAGRLNSAERLRDPLLARWERVRERGLLPDRTDAEGVSAVQLSERRERLASLLRGQSSLFEPLVKDVESRSLVAVLADHEGVVLYRQGAHVVEQTATLEQLGEGTRWSEDVRGTNAIGTSLVEKRPVAVLGGAHFDRANSGIFCYAAPVLDAHGEVICVLDVSGPMGQHDKTIGRAVRSTASTVECMLRTQAFESAVVGGLATLARVIDHVHGPAFVIDVHGRVLCSNVAAGEVLVDLQELPAWREAASRDGKLLVEGRVHKHALSIEPLRGYDGQPFALLVFAKRVQRSVRAAPAPTTRDSRGPDAFSGVLGADPALQREKARASAYARTEIPILLLAETGTGKELFARAIHLTSARRSGPFVPINCGAVPQSLLDSELFGHAPHAFTGASPRGSEGKIAAAHGGTLFLDEIGDMPAALQGLLLRFLDDGTYYRVGDSQLRKASVRIVCATCRDLPARVLTGEFRQDLFYRIQGACVSPPPLRERVDRVWLAEQLLAAQGGRWTLSRDAKDYISSHAWPGNVRELKSALLQASALATGNEIERADFSQPLLRHAAATRSAGSGVTDVRPRATVLRDAVDEALRVTNGNLS